MGKLKRPRTGSSYTPFANLLSEIAVITRSEKSRRSDRSVGRADAIFLEDGTDLLHIVLAKLISSVGDLRTGIDKAEIAKFAKPDFEPSVRKTGDAPHAVHRWHFPRLDESVGGPEYVVVNLNRQSVSRGHP